MAYTHRVVWEAVFFLVLLKIPVVYLGFVVWWAIREEPDRREPTAVAAVSDTPPSGPGVGGPRRPARRPHTGHPHGRPRAPRPIGHMADGSHR
jgi:hypothetical protein